MAEAGKGVFFGGFGFIQGLPYVLFTKFNGSMAYSLTGDLFSSCGPNLPGKMLCNRLSLQEHSSH